MSLVGAPQYMEVDHLGPEARIRAYLDSPWVTDSIMEKGITVLGDEGEMERAKAEYGVNPSTWECECAGRKYASACKHLVAWGLRELGLET